MKKQKKIISILFVLLPIVMILNIYCSIPSRIIVPQNSEYSLNISRFCEAEGSCTRPVSASGKALAEENPGGIALNTSSCGIYNIPIKIFNAIPLKTIAVTVTPMQYVVPSGDTIGIKMYTDGLLIVAVSDFTANDGTIVSPAKKSGLERGDRIRAVNGEEINTAEELSKFLSNGVSTLDLSIIRGNETFNTSITSVAEISSEKPRLGLWVRDSTAGIGTLTYYDPSNSAFASLGHAICDPDTGDIMKLRRGNVLSCNIMSVVKGERGTPGELVGSFSSKTFGTIKDNNELGVYGFLENTSELNFSEAIGVATRFQIKEGEAKILANVDGKGIREYKAEIVKVSKNAKTDNKGLVIKVTDEDLIAKTGGIVQGMSGAPILQNNLLVGAVTHVFVNDPTKGYGTFIELMVDQTAKLK